MSTAECQQTGFLNFILLSVELSAHELFSVTAEEISDQILFTVPLRITH